MIPSRQAGDILAGMWSLIEQVGRVSKTLVWDREAAIGGTGKLTTPAASFAGTLATNILLAPARDPEYKGMIERASGVFVGIDRGRLERSTIPAAPSARNLATHFRAVTGETMNIFAATDGGQ